MGRFLQNEGTEIAHVNRLAYNLYKSYRIVNLSCHSSYQKLINKPCAVKWCGICRQLKKKLVKLYSSNEFSMASVDTELIPSLRDEFEIGTGNFNSTANVCIANFHLR